MSESRRLQDLAVYLGREFRGDPELSITGVGALDTAGPQHITFLANPKYKDRLNTTLAGAVILSPDTACDRPCLLSPNPYLDFAKVVKLFAPPIPMPLPGIHPTAVVHAEAILGQGVAIGPCCVVGAKARLDDGVILVAQVYVGDETRIGEGSLIYPQVVLRERLVLGKRVIIHPGAVIGADGFGFAPAGDEYFKIPQIGTVIIEDDVEIGANTTIDRATLGETRIGRGCKVDNLVQIAHNDVIGPNTVIAAQAGISGSTRIGAHVMVGGQAGLGGHLEIGDRAILGAQGGITQSVPADCFVSGYPARPHAEAMRQLAALARLPELLKKVKQLEKRLENLEKK